MNVDAQPIIRLTHAVYLVMYYVDSKTDIFPRGRMRQDFQNCLFGSSGSKKSINSSSLQRFTPRSDSKALPIINTWQFIQLSDCKKGVCVLFQKKKKERFHTHFAVKTERGQSTPFLYMKKIAVSTLASNIATLIVKKEPALHKSFSQHKFLQVSSLPHCCMKRSLSFSQAAATRQPFLYTMTFLSPMTSSEVNLAHRSSWLLSQVTALLF